MTSVQGVFNMPDGGPNTTKGALAEVERRKFTAEEGDHLTLLNGMSASSTTIRCRNSAAS